MFEILEKIIRQSPWLESESLINQDFHINEAQKNKYIFKNKDFFALDFKSGVYILTGPRQIGKTTHLKYLIQSKINAENKSNFLYFNCDLLDKKSDIVDLVEKFLDNFPNKKWPTFIILDEITSIKDSILAIKYLIDQGLKNNIIYILTGSSAVNIKKTGEYLPGRRGAGQDFVFLPVTFRNFLKTQYPEINLNFLKNETVEKFYLRLSKKISLEKELNKYLISGGIPKIINNFLQDQYISLENFNIYKNWLISEVAKSGRKENFVKIIINRILNSMSHDVSYNAFTSDTGIGSHNTIYDYLTFLEDAFFIKQVYNFSFSEKKIYFKKNKKIYFTDTFLFWLFTWWIKADDKYYCNLNSDSVLKSKLIENLVFNRLNLIFKEVFFYKKTYEIDFICSNYAFECKYQNQISFSDIKELLKFPNKKFVICKNDFKLEKNVQFLPVSLFLLLPQEYFKKS